MSGSQSLFGNFDRKPLPPAFALMPLDEMVARIEEIRRQEAPDSCPTCGSAAPPETFRCALCGNVKDLRTGFYRDARNANGYASICKTCKSERYDKPAGRARKISHLVQRARLRRAS